jgi:alkylhydroperoxidase family enzyme
MAFIRYKPEHELLPGERVPDPDNIIQIHSIHPAVMRQHYELYREVMHGPGPLTRRERELIAVRVSALNACRY